MDTLQIVTLVSFAIAIALGIYHFWKEQRPLTVTEIQSAYESFESTAEELQRVGLMAVAAVEQLKATGKIRTNEEAFNEAFDYIATWPGMDKLDRKIIARAVEGAYRLYKDSLTNGNEIHSQKT